MVKKEKQPAYKDIIKLAEQVFGPLSATQKANLDAFILNNRNKPEEVQLLVDGLEAFFIKALLTDDNRIQVDQTPAAAAKKMAKRWVSRNRKHAPDESPWLANTTKEREEKDRGID